MSTAAYTFSILPESGEIKVHAIVPETIDRAREFLRVSVATPLEVFEVGNAVGVVEGPVSHTSPSKLLVVTARQPADKSTMPTFSVDGTLFVGNGLIVGADPDCPLLDQSPLYRPGWRRLAWTLADARAHISFPKPEAVQVAGPKLYDREQLNAFFTAYCQAIERTGIKGVFRMFAVDSAGNEVAAMNFTDRREARRFALQCFDSQVSPYIELAIRFAPLKAGDHSLTAPLRQIGHVVFKDAEPCDGVIHCPGKPDQRIAWQSEPINAERLVAAIPVPGIATILDDMQALVSWEPVSRPVEAVPYKKREIRLFGVT